MEGALVEGYKQRCMYLLSFISGNSIRVAPNRLEFCVNEVLYASIFLILVEEQVVDFLFICESVVVVELGLIDVSM